MPMFQVKQYTNNNLIASAPPNYYFNNFLSLGIHISKYITNYQYRFLVNLNTQNFLVQKLKKENFEKFMLLSIKQLHLKKQSSQFTNKFHWNL